MDEWEEEDVQEQVAPLAGRRAQAPKPLKRESTLNAEAMVIQEPTTKTPNLPKRDNEPKQGWDASPDKDVEPTVQYGRRRVTLHTQT